MPSPRVLLLGFIVVASAVAGCAQNEPETSTPTPTSTTTPPREPNNLVERLTIDMGEEGETYRFSQPGQPAGSTFRIPSGVVAGIHLVNVGDDEHEFLAGRGVMLVDSDAGQVPDGYNESLFESLPVDVFVYKPQKVEIVTNGRLGEIEVEPGGDFWLRTTFPESAKGTWEIGCFKPGHYAAGMKGTLVIE